MIVCYEEDVEIDSATIQIQIRAQEFDYELSRAVTLLRGRRQGGYFDTNLAIVDHSFGNATNYARRLSVCQASYLRCLFDT